MFYSNQILNTKGKMMWFSQKVLFNTSIQQSDLDIISQWSSQNIMNLNPVEMQGDDAGFV